MRRFPKTFSDILTMERQWPKKADRLLKPGADWDTSAGFASHQLARDAHIWDGYMTAGAALIDETERRPADRHVLIYPILFNYRHGLEVAMKWTIEQYGSLANVSLDPDDRNHDLWALWKLCKEIFAAATEDEEDEAVQAVEQVVKDFQQIDKSGTAFRYSKNKGGAIITLPADRIDLGNVQRVMEAVDNFFKGSDCWLDNLASAVPDYY
jgi:hypothetical protein